jgi:hypothetical protein
MRGYKIPDTQPPKYTEINCDNFEEDALNARDNFNLEAAKNAALCSLANPPSSILSRMKVALANMALATVLGINYSEWSDYILNHITDCVDAVNGTLCQAIYWHYNTSVEDGTLLYNATLINTALDLGMPPEAGYHNHSEGYISLAGGLFYSS